MKVWPASLQSRLMIMIFLALLLANALTLSLLLYERMSSARSVMLGNLEYDVATSVAILIVFLRKNYRIGWRVWRAVTTAISFLPDKLAIIPPAGVPVMRYARYRKP